MRSFVLTISLLAVGCASRLEPGGASGALGEETPRDDGATPDGGTDTMSEDVWICETGGWGAYDTALPDPPQDAEADTAAPADTGLPLPPVDCLADDFGPSSGKLIDFHYQKEVGTCPSSDCSDFVMFDPSCVMRLQVGGVQTKATLSADDCSLFTRWVTSDLLISRLSDTVTCLGKDVAGKFESTVVRRDVGYAAKKTASCEVEPFVSHRACIGKFRANYFPGK